MTLFEILSPVINVAAIIAFCALIGAPIYFFLEKTEMGARIKTATPWMGWDYDDRAGNDFTNFVIHQANYIRVPR